MYGTAWRGTKCRGLTARGWGLLIPIARRSLLPAVFTFTVTIRVCLNVYKASSASSFKESDSKRRIRDLRHCDYEHV